MNTIIVGTDFTISSLNACKYAALLAQKLNCKLTIFNLFEAPVMHLNSGIYGLSYISRRKKNETRINKVTDEILKLFPKLKIGQFVTSGSFSEELKKFTDTNQIEAAVMGLESKDKISNYVYGSHGVELAGKLNCPVIIIPKRYTDHQLARIMLVVDNNEKLVKSSLSNFERLVKQFKSKLTVLHVRTDNEIFDPVMGAIKINGKNYPIEIVTSKNIQGGVKKNCKKGDIDLVTIISKKHSAFYDFFRESNTKKLAFAAKVPIMAIHE